MLNEQLKSKDFLKRLNEFSSALRQQIDAAFDGWDDSADAIKARVAKVQDPILGFEYFLKNYFPHYLRNESQS